MFRRFAFKSFTCLPLGRRECLAAGDECAAGAAPATFFVVDETSGEKQRKTKKSPR